MTIHFADINQSEQIKVHTNQTIVRTQSDEPESTEKQTTK